MNIIVNLLTSIDVTELVVALIGVLSIFITTVVFPLIKSKLTNSQWETIKNYALAGVQAAEILIGAGNGIKKFEKAKQYIEKQCAAHGIKIDTDTIQIAIENAWKDLGLDHKDSDTQTIGF
ncbi:MAG: phage holin family protein [Negativibacillus massiliensis]|nr:phage holin family protein [Negativibacillus massiliensis]